MKKLFFIIVAILAYNIHLLTFDCYAQWQPTNGPRGNIVQSIAISGSSIFAGTVTGGVFVSTNKGNSWSAVNTGLNDFYIPALAINGSTIFAGTYNHGVFLSTNNGSTWTEANTGLTDNNVWTLAISDDNIFTGTWGGGVFLSTDNGNTWTNINTGLVYFDIHSLATGGNNLFAGCFGAIGLSANNGSTWTSVNVGAKSSYVNALVINGSSIYAGTDYGVHLSTDNGRNWTMVNAGLPYNFISSFARNGSNIFAGTKGGGVFLLTNNGSSWSAVNIGLTNTNIYSLAISDNFLYAGTDDGIWKYPLLSETNYMLSGKVTDGDGNPLAGVVMNGLPGNPVTDIAGNYVDFASQDWSGTVTPSKNGHNFNPAKRNYSSLQTNIGNQDFTGTYAPFPSIHIEPDSISISRIQVARINSPSYVFVDNSKNNPVKPKIKSQPELTEYSLGCVIPDSIVEYWRNHKAVPILHNTAAWPVTIDWSNNDSPVKNQAGCGSCWAFAATAFIENLGIRNDLSEQMVVSCSGGGACWGGWYGAALTFFQNTGIPDESFYPYTATNGNCPNINPSYRERITTVSNSLWDFPLVDDLKAQLQNGPLVVAMRIPTDNTFYGYHGGIINYNGDVIPSSQNHAVLLVGYDDNQQCFKAKNSWGPEWGESGYFRIAYDDVADDVQFGSLAVNGSGVYTEYISNASFVITNTGNDNLTITSLSDNANWLSVSGYPSASFTIAPSGSQSVSVAVDWSQVGSSAQTGIITIESDDSVKPLVLVKVTVIPFSIVSPTIGSITQPTCTVATGSVVLNDLPSTGTWTLTQYPGANYITGTGTSTTISGLAPGTYSFTVTDSLGYNSPVSESIVINAQPETPTVPIIETITQPTCITKTGSVVLSGLPATGTWTLTQYPGGNILTGTGTKRLITRLAPGIYTCTVTNSSGCTSAPSNEVVINAQPEPPSAPIIGTITQPTADIKTGSVVLNGLPATGTWILTQYPGGNSISGAGTSIIIRRLAPGIYTCTVTNSSGCTSEASDEVVIVTPSTALVTSNEGLINGTPGSINLFETNETIKIYPIPVSDELIIELKNNSEYSNFTLFNSLGRVVFRGNLATKTVVQTSDLSPGIYLIKLDKGKSHEFIKLIKQ